MNYQDLMKWDGPVYLKDIIDVIDKSVLKIQIERCKVSDKTVPAILVDDVPLEANPIEVDNSLPVIELEFSSYVSYSILNETFVPFQDYEVYEGGLVRVYSKSRYLDYINQRTVVEILVPNIVHYQIPCLDHIIDVISDVEPKVTLLNRDTMERL